MKTIISTFILLTIIACDAPQRTRLLSANEKLTNPYTTPNGSTPESSGNTGSLNGGGDSQSGEYAGCDFGYRHHTIDIGHFAICQSRSDETKFKFKTQVSNSNVQVCLIPTYRDGSGGSTYLGQPQCTYTQANKEYEGKLHKTRSGFSGYQINGVIVMKYGLHQSYFSCMNASINWPASACQNGPNTNQSCMQFYSNCPYGSATSNMCASYANNHMSQVCEQFKRSYSNSYIDISTR